MISNYKYYNGINNHNKYIRDYLIEQGFNIGILGTAYLKECVLYAVENPISLNNITNIFKKISEKYNCTTISVTRDIRTAITKAYGISKFQNISCFRGNIPTTKQMIVWLYDLLTI